VTPGRHGRRALALLVAVAALLASGCGGEDKPRPPAEPPGELALGMPVQDAVAQLFAVGFAGTGPQAAIVAKLRTRAWGMVVLQDANAQTPLQARTAFDQLNGTLTIALVDGGVKVKGTIFSNVSDQKKNKTLLNASIPVDAEVKVAELVIPLPNIK